jgi:hypothetical protein
MPSTVSKILLAPALLCLGSAAVADAVGSAPAVVDSSCTAEIYVLPLAKHPGVSMEAAYAVCHGDCAQPGYTCEMIAEGYPSLCGCQGSPTPAPTPPSTPLYSCSTTTGQCTLDPFGTTTAGDCIAKCQVVAPTPAPATPAPTPPSTPLYSCSTKTGQCTLDPFGTVTAGDCIAKCQVAPTSPTPAPAECKATRAYQQCGGNDGYTGPTCCPYFQGAQQVCHPESPQYSQCCPPGLGGCGGKTPTNLRVSAVFSAAE